MKEKGIHIFLIILIVGCFLYAGKCVFMRPAFRPLSSFELQEKYADLLENKLINLLEPLAGIGNVRTSVQAKIRHQNTTQTQFDFKNATRTVVHEKGPVLVAQSVSVLINEEDKNKLPSYQNLIKAAIGFDAKRGDYLSVELLPFVRIPLWTLGLNPIHLIRIGAGLVLLILLGVFWLVKELLKRSPKKNTPYLPNEKLWTEIEDLSSEQLASLLKTNRSELTAFILHRLSKEKASQIIELLPQNYMHQVILHLNYIERLSLADKLSLLQETEKHLSEMLQAIRLSESLTPKEEITFDSIKNWKDNDLQKLLCYVSKKDLVKALQSASLPVQQALARNIPPTLWQSLVQQTQMIICSKKESFEAQNKIMRLAELLKENR